MMGCFVWLCYRGQRNLQKVGGLNFISTLLKLILQDLPLGGLPEFVPFLAGPLISD